jgi:hypothetical protein
MLRLEPANMPLDGSFDSLISVSSDKGSAMAIVGPDLYRVVTVLVRSEVS